MDHGDMCSYINAPVLQENIYSLRKSILLRNDWREIQYIKVQRRKGWIYRFIHHYISHVLQQLGQHQHLHVSMIV